MKILVCIKQVPDMESRFKVNAAGDWYDQSDLAFRMNEYDEYAVEQAVQLKEQLGGEPEITVVSIGPERVGEPLRKALAMGCDRGVHIHDADSSRKDPWQIASLLAAFAREGSYDVIFTGMQSQDRGSAQVGMILAELLGLPSVTTIVGFSYEDGQVTVRRELEGGARSVVRVPLPALFTCQLGLNQPRYPTLPNIMKAKKKEILLVKEGDFALTEGRALTSRLFRPEKKGRGLVLEGDVAEQSQRLVEILKIKTAVFR